MKRLLCYAHFDGNGQVKPFVKHALNAMQPYCSKTIFVSNSNFAEDDRVELLSVCSDVLVNNNTGYDFYMWKLALEKVDLSLYDEVVLMNSSIYGPVSDIGAVFADMAELGCDFWGITECFQLQPHIQSYFLVFRRRVIASQAFRNFWDGVLPYVNKSQVILSYEVGLTQWLWESEFKSGVFCSFEELGNYCQATGKRLRRKDNTSVKHALELLNIGNPFLKRDAVRNQKVDMSQALLYLQKHSYSAELINEQMRQEEKCCLLCGTAGTRYRRGVKDFMWLNNVEQYNYYRCKSSTCEAVWLDGYATNHQPLIVYPRHQLAIHPVKTTFLAELRKYVSGNILIMGSNKDILMDPHNEPELVSSFDSISFGTHDEFSLKIMPPDVGTGEGLYDSILVANGFEMSADPLKKLAEYFRLLKPGGLLYLQTLNVKSPLSFLFHRYWYGLNAPRNKIIFNRKALKNALSRSGFIDVKITTGTARTHEYAWHSFNIIRNKWTSSHFVASSNWSFMHILQRCVRIVNFISGGCGEELKGIARKPI